MNDLPDRICAKLIEGPLGSEDLATAIKVPETYVLIELVKLNRDGLVKIENKKWTLTDEYKLKK